MRPFLAITLLFIFAVGHQHSTLAAQPTAERPVKVVPATEWLMRQAASSNETIRKVIEAARPTIGVPYEWGGTRLNEGIDCSNYTWLLYRGIGLPYSRSKTTRYLSRMTRNDGLRKISFEEAEPGDLLVYGYVDTKEKWHGHVVILVDKNGRKTGRKGLVLGAHGGDVDAVRFVTFRGFEAGYFKNPKMKLRNVLRVDGPGKT